MHQANDNHSPDLQGVIEGIRQMDFARYAEGQDYTADELREAVILFAAELHREVQRPGWRSAFHRASSKPMQLPTNSEKEPRT